MSNLTDFQPERPVAVIDRLQIKSGNQQAVFDLLTGDYAAIVASRGLSLKGAWLAPPFEQPGFSSDLIAIWEYETLSALWGARMAEEVDDAAQAIWAKIDDLTEKRTRQIARSAPMRIDAPEEICFTPKAALYTRNILILRPVADLSGADETAWVRAAESATDIPNIVTSRAGPHVAPSFLPGHFTWDVGITSDLDISAILKILPGKAEIIDHVRLGTPLDGGLRRSVLTGAKRTIMLRCKPGLDPKRLESFEQAIATTPRYIPEILNWRLSRVVGNGGGMGWTHSFEQEVADISVFSQDYLNHPYHWAIVERLFHPEAPERIADGFSHTFYAIDRSVLAEL